MFIFLLPLHSKASTEETPRAIAGFGLPGTLQSVASSGVHSEVPVVSS